MTLDLAKEVGNILEQVGKLVGRAVGESQGKGLSGPALRLNALHHELKELHEGLMAGAGAGPAPVAHSALGAAAAAAAPRETEAEGSWGSAFADRPTAHAAAAAEPAEELEESVAQAWTDEEEDPPPVRNPAPPATPAAAQPSHAPKENAPPKRPSRHTVKGPTRDKVADEDRDIWDGL